VYPLFIKFTLPTFATITLVLPDWICLLSAFKKYYLLKATKISVLAWRSMLLCEFLLWGSKLKFLIALTKKLI